MKVLENLGFGFGAISGGSEGLILALHSRIIPGYAQVTVLDTGD